MQSLTIPLSDNHGVALQHSPSLLPDSVVASAEAHGKLTLHSSYSLTDGTIMTFLFFTEREGGDACFSAFTTLHKSTPGLYVKVGWLHENAERAFAKKPYVKEKLSDNKVSVKVTDANMHSEDCCAYLVIYTARLSEEKREKVRALATANAVDFFEDRKEGGRLFLAFATDTEEEACRKRLNDGVGPLGRDISFADANDFALAKKSQS